MCEAGCDPAEENYLKVISAFADSPAAAAVELGLDRQCTCCPLSSVDTHLCACVVCICTLIVFSEREGELDRVT